MACVRLRLLQRNVSCRAGRDLSGERSSRHLAIIAHKTPRKVSLLSLQQMYAAADEGTVWRDEQ